jgi:biotin-[acetyl-CoA-carboxylase] ligase BirA-like protein
MSTTGPMHERLVTEVLLSLWRRGAAGGATSDGPAEVPLQRLLQDTLAPLPDVQTALEHLAARRCRLERTPAGVRLAATGIGCWADVLQDLARADRLRLGRRVMVFTRTASTNDIAWQCAATSDCDGLVVLADEQSAGRGRLGHRWLAKPEQSVLLSVLLRDVPAASVDRLTLLAGLAVATAAEDLLHPAPAAQRAASAPPPAVQIKWPNDVLAGGRKLAGVLVERRPAAAGPAAAGGGAAAGNGHVVIGIGFNVAQTAADFPPDLAPRATSLYQAAGRLVDRLRVAATLLRHLDRWCAAPPPDDVWLPAWKARCGMLNSRVRARTADRPARPPRPLAGQVIDVDPLLGLVLRDDAGATHFLSAQTTTLDA